MTHEDNSQNQVNNSKKCVQPKKTCKNRDGRMVKNQIGNIYIFILGITEKANSIGKLQWAKEQ